MTPVEYREKMYSAIAVALTENRHIIFSKRKIQDQEIFEVKIMQHGSQGETFQISKISKHLQEIPFLLEQADEIMSQHKREEIFNK